MKSQDRTFPIANIYSCSINHWAPKLELKPLPDMLKYAFLGELETLPVIISSHLNKDQEEKLLDVLGEHKESIGWTIADIKGIRLSVVMH